MIKLILHCVSFPFFYKHNIALLCLEEIAIITKTNKKLSNLSLLSKFKFTVNFIKKNCLFDLIFYIKLNN